MSEQERAVDGRWTDQEFADQWRQSRAGLLSLCAREMHGHLADAEDALGNATLAALRSARGAEVPRSPAAWLGHIARHACIDMHRARRRHQGRPVDREGDDACPEPFSRPGTDPEALLLGRETALRVCDAVAALPPHLRRPLLLRVEEQLSYAEIAALLGDSAENLRKRVQLARQLVRDALDRDERPRSEAETKGPLLAALDDDRRPLGRRLHPITVVDEGGAARLCWLLLDIEVPASTPARREHLARYVEAHPTGWRKRVELADLLLGAGELDAAAAAYRRALSHRGRDRALWLRLGLCLEAGGRAGEAVEAYRGAGRCAVSEGERLHFCGLGARAAGRADEAIAWLRRAAREDPSEAGHSTALAALLLSRDRAAEAADAVCAALRADPANPAALLLGRHAARQEKLHTPPDRAPSARGPTP